MNETVKFESWIIKIFILYHINHQLENKSIWQFPPNDFSIEITKIFISILTIQPQKFIKKKKK